MTSPAISPSGVSTEALREAFDLCSAKTKVNLADMPKYPTTWSCNAAGDYTEWKESFFEIGNWTNGFFTGMGVLALKDSADAGYKSLLDGVRFLFEQKLEPGNAENTMHDLGFLYSPYAVALYEHSGEEAYKQLGIKAAETLLARFNPKGNYFRAWGRLDEIGTDYDGLAIIDCLMNMPLLYWASRVTGDERFKNAAIAHTKTTAAHFVREDDTVFHSFRFNPENGRPERPDNYCGHQVNSHWARGTTWAMYGFALAYRHTGNADFLEVSLRVSKKFTELLPEDAVPPWDFRLTSHARDIKDSSAAAIAVCALQELKQQGHSTPALDEAKDRLLEALLGEEYLDQDLKVRGLLKKAEIGDSHDGTREYYQAKYAYTSWGDYFLMEALGRELGISINWW